MFMFILFDTAVNQCDNLFIGRTAFLFGYNVQLVQQIRVDADGKRLIFHILPPKIIRNNFIMPAFVVR